MKLVFLKEAAIFVGMSVECGFCGNKIHDEHCPKYKRRIANQVLGETIKDALDPSEQWKFVSTKCESRLEFSVGSRETSIQCHLEENHADEHRHFRSEDIYIAWGSSSQVPDKTVIPCSCIYCQIRDSKDDVYTLIRMVLTQDPQYTKDIVKVLSSKFSETEVREGIWKLLNQGACYITHDRKISLGKRIHVPMDS